MKAALLCGAAALILLGQLVTFGATTAGVIAARAAPTSTPTATVTSSPSPSPSPSPSSTPSPSPTVASIPPGQGGNTAACPGEWDVPVLWGHMCLDFSGIGGFISSLISGAFQGLLSPLLTPLLNALVATPNFLDGSWPLLDAFFQHVAVAASALFTGAVLYAAFRYLLQSMGQSSTFHDAIGAGRRAVVGAMLLLALHPALTWWFDLVNALSTYINDFGAQHGLSAVKVISDTFATQVTTNNGLMVLILSVVALLLILVIGIMRMMGVIMLAVLIPLAPLMVICWMIPELRPVASWWLESVIGFSVWGIGYSIVLQVSAILLTVLPRQAGFWSPTLAPLFLLAVFFCLYSVPRLVHGALGGAAFHASAVMIPVALTLNSARMGLGKLMPIK